MVPLLDINAQNVALESDFIEAFQRVFKSGQFILGPEVTALEDEIASFSGVEHAIGVSSGTDAILLALMALDIGPGDEVLCPSFTFFATAGCVARVGATPVFVDVDPATYNIDPADAARKVSSRTRAIIPVHLFGQCAEMDAISRLAEESKLYVIEDAAQSLGARYKGRSAGSMGDFGAFSFYPTKNLGGLGDGGMLTCRNADLARKARALRNHGAEQTYYHKFVGGNFRLDALQAAFLRIKFSHYSEYTERRRANAAYYTKTLKDLAVTQSNTQQASDSTRIVLPSAAPLCDHIWNQYTIRVLEKRDQLREYLQTKGVQTGVYYPVPLNQQQCFASLHQAETCPIATKLANEVLSLPIYPELNTEQLSRVTAIISEFTR